MVWNSLITYGSMGFGWGVPEATVDTESVHIVASNVVVDLLLQGFLALDALGHHLVILFHHH